MGTEAKGAGPKVATAAAKPAAATGKPADGAKAPPAPRAVVWPEIMNVRQASAYVKVSKSKLDKMACDPPRDPIPFFYVGKCRRYRKSDIDAWIERRMVKSVAQWNRKEGRRAEL